MKLPCLHENVFTRRKETRIDVVQQSPVLIEILKQRAEHTDNKRAIREQAYSFLLGLHWLGTHVFGGAEGWNCH